MNRNAVDFCCHCRAPFEHHCMVRTSPEEWNLASQRHHHDPTASSVVWLYRSVYVPGHVLLARLELEETKLTREQVTNNTTTISRPGSGPEDYAAEFVVCYGYRGTHPSIYYLCTHLSIIQSIYQSTTLPIYLYIYTYTHLSVNQ